MSSPQPIKEYPKNQIYNNPSKQSFQPTSKSTQQKNIINISGTSISQLSYTPNSKNQIQSILSINSNKPYKNNPQIKILYQRIQFLQKQLQSVTQLLTQQQQKKNMIQKLSKQNTDLRQNMQKMEQINYLLQKQLEKSQNNNKQLITAIKSISQQLQQIKSQQHIPPINQSKTSKSKQQVQQDIIHLNGQIQKVLLKLHTLNQDYQILREKNIILTEQNQQMMNKISEQQEKLSKQLKQKQQYKIQLQDINQEILLLKQEIGQVNELSIKKQKQMQDQLYDKEVILREQIKKLKASLEQQRNKNNEIRLNNTHSNKQIKSTQQVQSTNNTLLQIKSIKIKTLQLDTQMLKKQLHTKQQQIQQKNSHIQILQLQLLQLTQKLQQLSHKQKQKIYTVQHNYQSRIKILQQNIKNSKNMQYRYENIQKDNYNLLAALREKQENIYEMKYQYISKLNDQDIIVKQLEEELEMLRNKYDQKNNQVQQVQYKKRDYLAQLESVKSKLLDVHNQVRITNEVKDRYGTQLVNLKKRLKQLQQLSQQQQRHIRQIQFQHENSRKKIQDISIIQTTYIHKIDDVEHNNKQLQKMLLNQKIEKDMQNKKYRQLLQDYKQLNHQVTLQLKLYRDADNIDHRNCPINSTFQGNSLKQSSQWKQKTVVSRYQQTQLKKQLQNQRNKNKNLLQKHQKMLQHYKNIQLKLNNSQKQQNQSHFFKIDNSSLRAQINQLNIRIQEYKDTIQAIRKQNQNRNNDYQKIRYAMQREYQGKLQVQKMDIINQYNTLLRNRNVRIQPNEFKKPYFANQPNINNNHISYIHQNNSNNQQAIYFSEHEKIRYHPQYKKLQQEYMKLHRQFLLAEQNNNKIIIQCKDQIQKLKIQNQYHRKTIDQMHAEGYGLCLDDVSRGSRMNKQEQAQFYKNKYEQMNENYHKLYEEYVSLRSRNSRISDNFNYPNDNKLRQILKAPSFTQQSLSLPNPNLPNPQKSQLSIVKKLIDSKLLQLQITPRQQSSQIQRTAWFIQKSSQLIIQLRQDIRILKQQKKQCKKQNDKNKVKIQTLQYQKNHILQQLSIAIQKYKYLEDKHMKLSQGSFYTNKYNDKQYVNNSIYNSHNSNANNNNDHHHNNNNSTNKKNSIQIPKLNININDNQNHNQYNKINQKQKDIHFHQAGIIRQQRLSLLKKYQKQIQSIDSNGVN